MMISRELKHFHSENRTHVTKKEFSGTETNIPYAVCAPMDFTIYGASEQKADYRIAEGGSLQTVTEQGKNLYDMDREFDNVISNSESGNFSCDKTKVSEEEWLFDNMTAGGNSTAYFIIPLTVSQNTQYTLSLTVNRTNGIRGAYGIGNNKTADTWNVVAGVYWYTKVPDLNTDTRISMSFNSGSNQTLYFKGYFSYGASADDSCTFKEMQLETGSTMTDYEAFVPNSPSENYPSEIEPLLKEGTYLVYINGAPKSVELPALYAAGSASDKVIYDRLTGTMRLKKEVDEELLDTTKTIEENTAAVMTEPTYTALEPTDGYESGLGELPFNIYGKNLYDMDREFDNVIPNAEGGAYPCDKHKIGGSEWLFDNFSKGGSGSAYFIIPLVVAKNTQYALSLTVNRTNNVRGVYGIANNLTPDTWNVVAGVYWYTKVPDLNTDTRISMSFNSGSNETLYFKGYFCYGSNADDSCTFKDMQLEEGSAATVYEPIDYNPPESLSPSADYPHKIYPSQEFLLKSNGGGAEYSTKVLYAGCAIEVSDSSQANLTADGKHYIADYIEYDSKADTAKRYRYIDESLLDYTMQSKDQTQAVLQTPQTETITPDTDEYAFKNVKSIPGGCTVSCGTYAGGEALFPLQIKAAAKVIK